MLELELAVAPGALGVVVDELGPAVEAAVVVVRPELEFSRTRSVEEAEGLVVEDELGLGED